MHEIDIVSCGIIIKVEFKEYTVFVLEKMLYRTSPTWWFKVVFVVVLHRVALARMFVAFENLSPYF